MEFQLFDSEYVRKLTSGDAATEAHFNAYFGKFILIKLRARKVLAEMAEEVCQETLLRVLKSLRRGAAAPQAERFGAFVNEISNQVLVEFVDRELRHSPAGKAAAHPADGGAHIDEALVNEERKLLVLEALNELPPKDREILRMAFMDSAERHLITDTFKVDADYLRVLLHRAKSKFYTSYTRKDRRSQPWVARMALFILCSAAALKLTTG